jgi:hypothetical protein
MGLSWCMLCGFNSIVPYYYAIYLAILLIHRCVKRKSSDDWDRYKEFDPYRYTGIVKIGVSQSTSYTWDHLSETVKKDRRGGGDHLHKL